MTQYFETLNEFPGWGDLEHSIWFLGMEEGGGDWHDENQLKGERVNRTYRMYAEIVAPLLDEADPSDFYCNRLGQKNGRTFIANILPLAMRISGNWPEYYHQLFGFASYEEYLRYMEEKSNRFELLREKSEKARLIICHGKEYWNLFQKVFQTTEVFTL